MGGRRNFYKILVGKLEGRRPPETPRRRWECNVKMNLRWCWRVWSGSLWTRIKTSGRPLWT